jgi:hypothetical protein
MLRDMVRLCGRAPETVDRVDGLPEGAASATVVTSAGDDREHVLDVLRAGGLRFRDGGRWRPALF